MQTKTIIIIAVIVIIAIGVIWYASSTQVGSQIAPKGGPSENAPDLTTDDSVFSEMEDTSNGLE